MRSPLYYEALDALSGRAGPHPDLLSSPLAWRKVLNWQGGRGHPLPSHSSWTHLPDCFTPASDPIQAAPEKAFGEAVPPPPDKHAYRPEAQTQCIPNSCDQGSCFQPCSRHLLWNIHVWKPNYAAFAIVGSTRTLLSTSIRLKPSRPLIGSSRIDVWLHRRAACTSRNSAI